MLLASLGRRLPFRDWERGVEAMLEPASRTGAERSEDVTDRRDTLKAPDILPSSALYVLLAVLGWRVCEGW